ASRYTDRTGKTVGDRITSTPSSGISPTTTAGNSPHIELITLVTVLGTLVCPSRVWAHRLDELLQATQVTIGEDHVVVNVYLTPGILVAPSFDRTIDRDGNGVIDDR